ncbi:ABC transporter permease [Rhizohabitans arisaemae]|uniref:ABC transporter permease n=1 Tax=Rhizohabitans arisaemae TaxID=2720610 RepID=UPI0024B0FA0A|nr:ABC transporter permease [Rhizohabitans arisaemae]
MATHSRLYWAFSDSLTMIARSLRHITRNFELLFLTVVLPVFLLLLFVYVFGGVIDVGSAYVDYVVPGLILMCAGYGASMTTVTVAHDMVNGIVERFRSLPIVSSAMLTGHVVASLVRNMISVTLVVAVALLIGFGPTAGPLGWLAALGMIALYILAISWAAVALGLIAKTVEGANGFSFFILFIPYLSSAFVPAESLPSWLRPIAENQPITPTVEAVRGFLMGTPLGNSVWLSFAWCGGILLISVIGGTYLFKRRTSR